MARLDKCPTLHELQEFKVIEKVAPDWKQLAIQFDFDSDGAKCATIHKDYFGSHGVKECCTQSFRLWLKGEGKVPPTWRELIRCLENIERKALAQTLRKEFTENEKLESDAQAPSQAYEVVSATTYTEETDVITFTTNDSLTTKKEEAIALDRYSFIPEVEGSFRQYQHELAIPGLSGLNYIVCAPTGTGKTMVAAWIIAHHLQSRRKKVVLFVVDKVHLAVQQKKALEERIYGARVHEVTGTGSSSKKLAVVSSTDFGDQELSQSMHEGSIDVVVTTAGYIECTMKGQVKITDFSLLVIDECHHTSKQHPFAKLMFHYLKEKQNGSENLPQVVGLTASPGAGGSSDMEKIRDNLIKLCAYLDSTGGIKTVKDHKSELDRHTNKPTHEIITNDARPAKDPFLQLIGQTMRDIEKEFLAAHSHLLSDRMTLQYLQQLKELQKVETTKKDEMNALNVLISLNKGLMIYMDLEKEDAMKHFKEERNFLPKGEVVSSTQQKLHTLYNELLQQLHSIHCNTNPLLLKLESIIREEMPQKTESRAVVIVETQLQALSICKWLGEREALKKFVIPMPVVGQQKEDGMTKAQQVNSISSLKEGHANVLVATSIVEEGMDIPKCNLVIRYQHVSNEIATIQVEGRARAEISKVFTILSSQKKADQEYANKIRAKLIEEAIYHVPTGLHLKKQLARIQEEILKQEKIKHESMERSKLYSSAKIQCRNCRELLCYSSDLRKLFDCFVVVIEPSFVTKVTIEPKKEPEIQQKFIRTHKLFCKECGNAVGVKGNPINSNNELFALAYKRVRCNDSTMKSWNLIDIEKLPD